MIRHVPILLLAAAAILTVCVLLARLTSRVARRAEAPEVAVAAAQPLGSAGSFALIRRDPYLTLIAALTVLLNVVNTSGEYLFGRYVGSEVARLIVEQGGPLKIIGSTFQKNPFCILSLEEGKPIRTVADLAGKTIGIQSGNVYTKFINDSFKDIASIRVYKTSPERDLDLVAGRIDASFDDVTYYASNNTKKDTASIVLAGPKLGGPIWGPGEGLAFRKQDADLKTKFDTAIGAALADGTVKKLADKWFKTDVTP